jgi:hypothetical protein
MTRVKRETLALRVRQVNAEPLSASTSAGTPNSWNARVIAVIAPAASSTSQANVATSSRVQSSSTSNTTALCLWARMISVASIW